jgi:hypothetical protein
MGSQPRLINLISISILLDDSFIILRSSHFFRLLKEGPTILQLNTNICIDIGSICKSLKKIVKKYNLVSCQIIYMLIGLSSLDLLYVHENTDVFIMVRLKFSKRTIMVCCLLISSVMLCANRSHWNLLILCHFGEMDRLRTRSPCMLLLDSLLDTEPKRLEPDIRRFSIVFSFSCSFNSLHYVKN